MDTVIWIGIVFCISQSAMFSGSNLAFFSISKLRLEVETAKNNPNAQRILALRQDANFLLTTILWGNVGINVLLTLLADSVMAGLAAALPGVAASHSRLPVIGVPIPAALGGIDALLSIAQMPPGIPVAAVGVGSPGAKNAAVLAARILALKYPDIKKALDNFRQAL